MKKESLQMNKRTQIFLLAAILMLFAACRSAEGINGNNSDGMADGLVPGAAQGGDATTPPDADNNGRLGAAFSDENLTVSISFDRESYTVDEMIGLQATITNNSSQPIIFEKGSGSNSVPAALTVTMGAFVNTYTPMIATMDYQVESLEPGQSVTFALPHAPYIPANPHFHGFGFGQGVEFFRTDDYTPAEPGEARGSFTFRYLVSQGVEPIMHDFSEENIIEISGEFSTVIVE